MECNDSHEFVMSFVHVRKNMFASLIITFINEMVKTLVRFNISPPILPGFNDFVIRF